MFGSEIVKVTTGMVFTYLLLSPICSAISELIERNPKNRAADLERRLRELLNDPDGSSLVKEVYDHCMISGPFKGEYDPSQGKSDLPSYIPLRSFALAIIGIVLPDSPGSASVHAFRQAITRIENPPVKKALLAMLGAAQDDLNKFRDNSENWFNRTMDRVSGWYKHLSQFIVFALGFAIAIAMNVNSQLSRTIFGCTKRSETHWCPRHVDTSGNISKQRRMPTGIRDALTRLGSAVSES